MKYTPAKVNEICKLIASGLYTNAEICKKVGIHIDTFHDWKNNKPEFSEAVQNAQLEKLPALHELALSSLAKGLKGYKFKETTKEDGKLVKTVTKFVPPNNTLIIFTLCNTAPDKFSRNEPQKNEVKVLPPVREIEDASDISE